MCSICQYVFFHTALMFRKKIPVFAGILIFSGNFAFFSPSDACKFRRRLV